MESMGLLFSTFNDSQDLLGSGKFYQLPTYSYLVAYKDTLPSECISTDQTSHIPLFPPSYPAIVILAKLPSQSMEVLRKN